MPIVFSPGEVEVRPLYPDAVTYTTAQKVADLLGIGPGEAVAASANTIANAVFVTGADYRAHGFSEGDTILIYSDAFPIGLTTTISIGTGSSGTGIESGGGNGVRLNVDATIATAVDLTDLQVADNTYIQNQAAFTNGKTRGMTRDIVETRIKEVQDRVDNVTHNAWRPMLVVAEYINFDTYKPYRRRYYTDYVGTTPLLFRNIQQILRIELWQGADYREIASAEARVEIVNHSELNGDSIYLCPGDGGFAKLQATNVAGINTVKWLAAFDEVSTAQSLADLINKDSNTNRAGVTFTVDTTSPAGTTFSLPDASSSTGSSLVHVNNEFLVSANADYGNGKLKITSMRQTKAGIEATIAVTDSANIAVTQTQDVTGSGTYASGTSDITFTDTLISGLSITTAGTGYSDGIAATTTTGSGSGCTVNVVVTDGRITTAGISVAGTGYGMGEILTVSGGTGGKVTVSTMSGGASAFAEYGLLTVNNVILGYRANNALKLSNVVVLSGSLSNAVHTFAQSRFQTDLAQISGDGADQGRLKDWWLDSEMGIIYFNNSYPFFEWNAVKASYIYGERYVEKAVQEACTKMVAADLLMSDDRSVLIPEGTQNVDLSSKIQLWRQEAEKILNRYKEVVVFD
jgi:hypothetical protein